MSWSARGTTRLEALRALPPRTKFAAAGALMLVLLLSLISWRLTRSVPTAPPALPVSARNEQPKSEPAPQNLPAASSTPQVGASNGAGSIEPLAPPPERAEPASVSGGAKKPNPRSAPKRRARATFDMKEDPY